MFSSFVLCISLIGDWVPDPPPRDPLEVVRGDSVDSLLRNFLEFNQRGNARFEWLIQCQEKSLEENLLNYTPETLERERKVLAEWKEDLRKTKLIERELVRWVKERKENPGSETDLEAFGRLEELFEQFKPAVAPMPREVKRTAP